MCKLVVLWTQDEWINDPSLEQLFEQIFVGHRVRHMVLKMVDGFIIVRKEIVQRKVNEGIVVEKKVAEEVL